MMKNTPESIFQVASGFMASKHLFVANEIGLFAHLAAGPSTLDELAQRIGIPRRTLHILADAMVALGFLEREAKRYHNGPVAATFLSGQTPADLRPFLRFWNEIVYRDVRAHHRRRGCLQRRGSPWLAHPEWVAVP